MSTILDPTPGHSEDALLGGPASAAPIEARAAKLLEDVQTAIKAGVAPTDERLKSLEAQFNDELKLLRAEWSKYMSAMSLPGSAEEQHKGKAFKWSKLYRGVATGDWRGADLEKEIVDQTTEQVRAMATTPDSAGGFVVPIEIMQDQIIPLIRAESIVMDLGARLLSGLQASPVRIPRVSGGTTAYWVTENASITTSDMTLEQLQLTPHILATLTPFSELLGEVGEGVEAMIREDQALSMAVKLDAAALKGTGASGEPIGVLNMTGVPTATWASPLIYNNLIGIVQTLRGNNTLRGDKVGWALANGDLTEILQMADTAGTIQPTSRRMVSEGPNDRIMGYPWKVSTELSTEEWIFGNWNDLIVGQWGGAMVATTNALGFASMQNHIRTAIKVDTGVRHVNSFVIQA